MSYKPSTTNDFYEGFASQPTKIIGQPTYNDLVKLRDTLYHLAAAVPSHAGGGQHGHLGMLMPPTVYATIAELPWNNPPNPVLPALQGLTQHQILEAQRRFSEDKKVFQEAKNLDRALVKFLEN